MRRITIPLGCVLLLLAFGGFQQSPQAPDIRVDVEAVNVLVTVTDRNNRFVTDIPRHRFRVYEDKVPQVIDNFRHETDLPLQMALLFDTSASVRLQLESQKKAASQFLHAVMRPHDQALLVEFDTGITLLHDFSDRPGPLAQQLRDLRAGGGTALMDALYRVADEKMAEGTGRKVAVVISDGDDLASHRSFEEALDMLHRAGVVVYAIGTGNFTASASRRGESILNRLAENTGGRAFFPYSPERLDDVFDAINEELRSQYSLTYVPKNQKHDGKFRRIRVRIEQGRGLTVRHREGYYPPRG
jgi:Ca-activated chloride channel homolog